MPYQVNQLLKDVGAPVSAVPDEPVRDALDRMLHYGFSQLPVVKGTGQQRQFYFITHESILVALHNFGSRIESSGLRVDDALVRVPNVYRATDDLFDLLGGLRDLNAALIVDDDRNLIHVITSYDTSRYFRQWAEDTMQVRDVEHLLRRIINAAFRKPDGDIDEQARRSAVEEMTSSNRTLRKKFGLALQHYVTQQSKKSAVLKPERLDFAFLELVREREITAIADPCVIGDHHNKGTAVDTSATEEPGASGLLAAQSLRFRFEAGLRVYLDHESTDVMLDDALVDDAFKFIYDRNEQVKEFGELTLADYIQLFFKEICWGRCKDVIKLGQDEVGHMLEGVRETRNILAHFREEEVTAQKRLQLKTCADWLSARERVILTAFETTAHPTGSEMKVDGHSPEIAPCR